jgi:hypothetical protein
MPLKCHGSASNGDHIQIPGQSRHFGHRPATSGLPLETDIVRAGRHVSKVPMSDIAPAFLTMEEIATCDG